MKLHLLIEPASLNEAEYIIKLLKAAPQLTQAKGLEDRIKQLQTQASKTDLELQELTRRLKIAKMIHHTNLHSSITIKGKISKQPMVSTETINEAPITA